MLNNDFPKSDTLRKPSIICNASYSLIEDYKQDPKPIILLGSAESSSFFKQTPFSAYIELCDFFGLQIHSICDLNPKIQGSLINRFTVLPAQEVITAKTDAYVCIVSQIYRHRKNGLAFIEQSGFTGIVYEDFPFDVPREKWPWMRQWCGQKWFYDMLYGDAVSYTKSPEKYFDAVHSHAGVIPKNNFFVMKNYENSYVTIRDNLRVTTNQPENYRYKVMLFGSCIVYGDKVEDQYTIASSLQRRLNQLFPDTYFVQNYGVVSASFINALRRIFYAPIEKGDILILLDEPCMEKFDSFSTDTITNVIFSMLLKVQRYCAEKGAELYFLTYGRIEYDLNPANFHLQMMKKIAGTLREEVVLRDKMLEMGLHVNEYKKLDVPLLPYRSMPNVGVYAMRFKQLCLLNNIRYHDMQPYFKNPHNFGITHGDRFHLSIMGNDAYGFIIRDILCANYNMEKGAFSDNYMEIWEKLESRYDDMVFSALYSDELDEYLDMLKEKSKDNSNDAGVIVMNCNPFTNGHRYLIETSASQVEHLYVLVVEEDKSSFEFKDRFQMVLDGTSDLKNVVVLPSGKFVISSLTFSEYFSKETNQTEQIDASQDLTIFATKIAPALKATKRFVGEEPLCVVTNAYNEQMRKILPQHNIELIVIPRKESEGVPISATNGRKKIEEKDIEGLRRIFPETTLVYLRKIGKL